MIIFFDIETVYETNDYENYLKKDVWEKRYCKDLKEWFEEAYYEKAPLYAEFGKIVCISVGLMNAEWVIVTKSYYSADDEKSIIKEFYDMLEKAKEKNGEIKLCGHNIKSFDIPFLYRRSIINGIKPPHPMIDITGEKDWELPHIDTLKIWRGWSFTSAGLETIALCLGIPSPKEELDWSQVAALFYADLNVSSETLKASLREKAKEAITKYCELDVRTTALVYKKITDPESTVLIS